MQAFPIPSSESHPPISGFPLAPGVRLGKFEIMRELAAGGMGKVYVAHDTLTGAAVALKVLIPASEEEPARLARFKRESLIGWRLSHPNIIHTYDIGEDAGFYFISMELLDGEDLRTLLDREPHLDLTRIAGLCLQVLAGLEFAHEQGVIHRDFKPQNIFVTRTGAVKILDFGVAQALRISSHTTDGTMVGTPAYMSPEGAQGKPNVDGRADIYSFGVVLYEMLAGRLPFQGDSPIGIAAAHVYEAPPPISQVHPTTPTALAALVMRCLEKDPAARYASVGELREAFLSALREAGVPVDQVSAAIANARTPTPIPASPVEVHVKGAETKVLPRPEPARPPLNPMLRRLLAILSLGGLTGVAVAVSVWPQPYHCDAARRLEVGDVPAVEASILGMGNSRMARACSLQARAALALVNSHVQEAGESTRAALALEPELVWANVLSGDLAAQAGDAEGARGAYVKATTAKVGSPAERALAWARLARVALDANQLDAAQHDLDEATRTGAAIPEVYHLLAQLDMKRANPAGAAEAYGAALAAAPGDGVAQVLLDDLRAREKSSADTDRQRWIAQMLETLDARAKALRGGAPPPPLDWKAGERPRVIALEPPRVSATASTSRAGLGDALGIALERSLGDVEHAKVVDRELLPAVLSEMMLAGSSAADPAARLATGKLLAARYLVESKLTRLDDTLYFNVRVIDTETTEIVASLSPEIPAAAKPAEIAAALSAEIAKRI